jgi:hypothetical protein
LENDLRARALRVVKLVFTAGTWQACNGGQPASVVGLRHSDAVAGLTRSRDRRAAFRRRQAGCRSRRSRDYQCRSRPGARRRETAPFDEQREAFGRAGVDACRMQRKNGRSSKTSSARMVSWAIVETRPLVSVLICERGGRMQVGIEAKGQRKEWAAFDRWQAAGFAEDFANYMKIQLLSNPRENSSIFF